MARDLKYGEVVLEKGSIGEDEPVFVMRAQDRLVPQVLAFYRDLCVAQGSPEHHVQGIVDAGAEITVWQARNHTQVPRSDG